MEQPSVATLSIAFTGLSRLWAFASRPAVKLLKKLS
jgi:hypothetical protein